MAFLAVDKVHQGHTVQVYEQKPFRHNQIWSLTGGSFAHIGCAAAKLLVGRDLTWEDAPVEIIERPQAG